MYQEIGHEISPAPSDDSFFRIAHFHQSTPLWNSLPRQTITGWSRVDRSCNPINLDSCHTKYFSARRMKVTFHNFPVRLSTSFAGTTSLDDRLSARVPLNISIVSRGNKIRPVWVLTSHPEKVRFTSQLVLFAGDKIEGSLGSPGTMIWTQSEANGAERFQGKLSPSSCWMWARAMSSALSTPK